MANPSIASALPTAEELRQQWYVVGGIVIALFGMDMLGVFLPAVMDVPRPLGWVVLLAPHWIVTAVVVGIVLWIERRRLVSIGLTRPSLRDVLLGIVGFVAGVASFVVTGPLVRELGLTSTGAGIATLDTLPVWVVAATAVTAGITEEVMFRGYPIERLTELTGSVWVGAGVTFVVFTVGHVGFWGLGGAIQIGVWTLIVTLLYVRTRNLPACILLHTANDLFAFVVLPALLDVGSGP